MNSQNLREMGRRLAWMHARALYNYVDTHNGIIKENCEIRESKTHFCWKIRNLWHRDFHFMLPNVLVSSVCCGYYHLWWIHIIYFPLSFTVGSLKQPHYRPGASEVSVMNMVKSTNILPHKTQQSINRMYISLMYYSWNLLIAHLNYLSSIADLFIIVEFKLKTRIISNT